MDLFLNRNHDHRHDASFDGRLLVNVAGLSASLDELLHNVVTDLLVSHLTSLITKNDANLITGVEKTNSVVCLGVEVVNVDAAGELNLLDLDGLLLLLSFLFLLVTLIAVLAVVHDLAYRRVCGGGNQYKVQSHLVRFFKRVARAHNAKLLAVACNNANFLLFDLLIDRQFFRANGETPPLENKKCADKTTPHTNKYDRGRT